MPPLWEAKRVIKVLILLCNVGDLTFVMSNHRSVQTLPFAPPADDVLPDGVVVPPTAAVCYEFPPVPRVYPQGGAHKAVDCNRVLGVRTGDCRYRLFQDTCACNDDKR